MDLIWQKFTEWLKELLISGIMDNVNGLFDNVNSRVAGIAGQVGATPQGWNSGVYGMIRTLSDNVILPIAGVILAFVMTLELIQLITEKNNMHDVDTWMFFKWIFKTACAVLIVTNTWNIVMGVFEAAQSVVNSASGIIISDTSLTFNEHIAGFEAALAEMEVWSLLGLWLESVVVHLSMWALTICIFIICYGRMIEIYCVTSIAPIPMATMANREWGQMGQNYLRSLLALGFQGFLIIVCVAIYAVLIQNIVVESSVSAAIGTPGSGKSFSAKREIANVFLVTNDDIIICDPEAEYGPLVEHLHGQVVKISPTSTDYLNPMDLNLNYSDDENPLSLKSDFILSLCELIVGGKDGLMPVEKTIIDRCVRSVYREYLSDPRPEKMPILEDLYNELRRQDEKEAQYIATALEIYVTGSLNVFNHRSNVNIENRVVSFDIKELGKQLKKIGMLVVQDAVWNRVTINREQRKSTRYYIDEMHLLLKEEQTAAYTVEIWKRFRKWGGVPTGITQNVKDLLSSREVENIFENSDYVYMLNQASGDRQILAKQLNISPHQLSYVTQSAEGEGLLFYGSVILPFVDRFPKDTELYKIITTKLSDLSEQTGEEAKDAITE